MQSVVKHNNKAYELNVIDLPRPTIKKNEVLVKVSGVGICGSDLHMYAGHSGYDWISYPLVLGHEVTGKVVEASNQDLLGKRCVINPYIPCGECEYCLNSQENRCDNNQFFLRKEPPQSLQFGFRKNGGMAEYITVPEKNVLPVSDEVSVKVAAISEGIAVGLSAVEKVDRVAGKTAVIFGPGPIGLGIASVLVGLQIDKLVMVGVEGDEGRLERAREIGVDFIFITNDELIDGLLEFNKGYDMVFDCSGHYSVPNNAVKILKKGGELILVGISTNEFSLQMDQVVRGEIQIKGSYGVTKDVFQRTLEYAADAKFPFDKIVSSYYDISNVKAAFDAALNKATGKIVLKINN